MWSGLAVALLGALAGCKSEEEIGDDRAAEIVAKASADPGDRCVEFRGSRHCALGGADVFAEGDQALIAKNLDQVEEDGVAILLPEVTEFRPTGVFESRGGPSQMIARSINEGVSTSMMKVDVGEAGISLSASFTGAGDESTYSAIFYREGGEVARIANIRNGEAVGIYRFPCEPWPWCIIEPLLPPVFHVYQRGENLGSCSWQQEFPPGQLVGATLPSGEKIEADRIELREEVPAKGSYPYLTFNRIDYNYDGGALILTDEKIE